MADKTTLSAQIDKNSQLYADFEEHEKRYESRSEAVRAALRDGIADNEITRSEFEDAMERQQREFRLGAWESAVLMSSALLATLAIVLAVLTITPLVSSFEGIVGAVLLVMTAITLVVLVQRGFIGRFQGALADTPTVDVRPEVSD